MLPLSNLMMLDYGIDIIILINNIRTDKVGFPYLWAICKVILVRLTQDYFKHLIRCVEDVGYFNNFIKANIFQDFLLLLMTNFMFF